MESDYEKLCDNDYKLECYLLTWSGGFGIISDYIFGDDIFEGKFIYSIFSFY